MVSWTRLASRSLRSHMKLQCRVAVAGADEPGNNHLGVGIYRGERPNVASAIRRGFGGRTFFSLA